MIDGPTCKRIRSAFGLSGEQMGALIGKHSRTWYRYEAAGCSDLTAEILLAVLLRHADARAVELERARK
jgi:hypothetical protein